MKPHLKIVIWLYVCCFMIFAMAVIGAITRLSEAGLSITEWKPVSGALPPLSETSWQRAFALYKQSPEFAHKHFWMSLEDFKAIYFWEWLHRLWGRLIGIVYALPLLYFALKKQIPSGYGWKLSGVLLLGGLQGVIGWWMVKSGLSDRPDVSQFRLAIHLDLALLIFSLLWWLALDLKNEKKQKIPPKKYLRLHGVFGLALLAVTITWGAFTAGLDAGKVFTTFPLMNGHFTPDTAFDPAAVFHDRGWVQFTHRWLAVATAVILLLFAARRGHKIMALAVFLQVGLGVMTLLTATALVPAALHQANAIVLLALTLEALHQLKRKS